MSIRHMYEKLKSILSDEAFFISVLLVLVGAISFGLGRQSAIGTTQNMIVSQPSGVIFTESSTSGVITPVDNVRIVASRSGTKYYLPNCPGVSRIKDENKIYFDSVDLATAAGYAPASNCPGL